MIRISDGRKRRAPGSSFDSCVEIRELWRYLVKSMGGERLEEAELLPDCIHGDRLVQVVSSGRHIALDCSVVRGGTIRVGDQVELIPAR